MEICCSRSWHIMWYLSLWQALAPASTQAVGARSWAQASVTHGTPGDGESFSFFISYTFLKIIIKLFISLVALSKKHSLLVSPFCRWKGIKPTVAILSRGISHPAGGWRPGQSWQRTGHCRSVVWARTKPPPPEWVMPTWSLIVTQQVI